MLGWYKWVRLFFNVTIPIVCPLYNVHSVRSWTLHTRVIQTVTGGSKGMDVMLYLVLASQCDLNGQVMST